MRSKIKLDENNGSASVFIQGEMIREVSWDGTLAKANGEITNPDYKDILRKEFEDEFDQNGLSDRAVNILLIAIFSTPNVER